jgi:dihydroorotate dehydrogenase (NAD+) catalytic subunit
MAAQVTREVRRFSKKPVLIKLSPNVTDITEIARAVEDAGADGISLINTLLGMSIDARKGKILLANGTGGLSGPAIKPVALRMVYQVCQAVKIPVLGLGGITTGEDAAEFLMAGASAVSVGTAALVNPLAPVEILEELKAFMLELGYDTIGQMQQAFLERRDI